MSEAPLSALTEILTRSQRITEAKNTYLSLTDPDTVQTLEDFKVDLFLGIDDHLETSFYKEVFQQFGWAIQRLRSTIIAEHPDIIATCGTSPVFLNQALSDVQRSLSTRFCALGKEVNDVVYKDRNLDLVFGQNLSARHQAAAQKFLETTHSQLSIGSLQGKKMLIVDDFSDTGGKARVYQDLLSSMGCEGKFIVLACPEDSKARPIALFASENLSYFLDKLGRIIRFLNTIKTLEEKRIPWKELPISEISKQQYLHGYDEMYLDACKRNPQVLSILKSVGDTWTTALAEFTKLVLETGKTPEI